MPGASGSAALPADRRKIAHPAHTHLNRFGAQELAAAQYPATEAGCVTNFQTNAGCANQTTANACDGNETYHASYADDCVDQVRGLECSQVRDPNLNTDTAAPACGKVCAVD